MHHRVYQNYYLLIIALILQLGLFSNCTQLKNSLNDANNGDPELSKVFSNLTAEALKITIIDLPPGLNYTEPVNANNPNKSDIAEPYKELPRRMQELDARKKMLRDIVIRVLSNGALMNARVNTETALNLPPDPVDNQRPNPVKALIQKTAGITGENYDWKVKFSFAPPHDQLSLTFKLTVIDDINNINIKLKGEIIASRTTNDELAKSMLNLNIPLNEKIDFTFDSTNLQKSLDIKYISDLTPHINYFKEHYLALNTAEDREQLEKALDIERPSKIFINANFDGTVYGLYGISYHPGWVAMNQMGVGINLSNSQTMFMFKAKANNYGAKLALAIADENATDFSNIWTSGSLSNLLPDIFINDLNQQITNSNNPDKQAIIQDILALDTKPGTDKTAITKTDLDILKTQTLTNHPIASKIQADYLSISYMINPAFYLASSGFAGTYEENASHFYLHSYDSNLESFTLKLNVGNLPPELTQLINLNLNNMDTYTPTTIRQTNF